MNLPLPMQFISVLRSVQETQIDTKLFFTEHIKKRLHEAWALDIVTKNCYKTLNPLRC
jgi:hypothetical protein